MLESKLNKLLTRVAMFGSCAEPSGQMCPNALRALQSEDLQDAESDGVEVEKPFKRFNFALDLGSQSSIQMGQGEVLRPQRCRGQGFEPKAIAKAPEQLHQGPKGDLNFESPPIGFNHLRPGEGDFTGKQDKGFAAGQLSQDKQAGLIRSIPVEFKALVGHGDISTIEPEGGLSTVFQGRK